ncbi:thioesterase family protein [Paremcibacter congregatus]|uniref:thioesterase family protein n=1 Tax=Paremcibacter congregatus TaxID=2043170 RepID=UPI0030EBB035|tara:strand:+ start:1722 stop:2249 length:528 start_codon:yes stop_codon:yes gene_type:complete
MPEDTKYGPVLLETTIKEEWIDFNGHMNMAYYVLLFDQALTNFLEELELGLNYVRTHGKSMFALENHVTYQHELKQGDPVHVHFQLLDFDSKFMHYFMCLIHRDTGARSATMEQISLHVNMENRLPTRFSQDKIDLLHQKLDHHKTYGVPREIGRSIAIRRPAKKASSKPVTKDS